MEIVRDQQKSSSHESLKLAIAMALVRSKLLQKPPAPPQPPPPPPSSFATVPQPATAPPPYSEDALKWKRKAKERKLEILRLKEDLKVAEDGSQCDIFPKSASCKCYFFDKLGILSPKRIGDGSDQRFSEVLRRRFLRQVRIKERKRRRTDDSLLHQISERDNESNVDQLSASVDFLVELCDSISPQSLEKGNFKNWCHQAVDFILRTLATMSPTERIAEPVEGIINSLIMRLLRRMFSALEGGESHHFDTAVWFYIQHLMRKVGNEAFVGQRLIFAVSQRISVVAESLLFMDPFDDAFSIWRFERNSVFFHLFWTNNPSRLSQFERDVDFKTLRISAEDMEFDLLGVDSMGTLSFYSSWIQLIEFLVSDYLLTWSNTGDFDTRIFEEWVISVLHGRKALELLENRNSLYVLYIDRVIGVVAKQVGQLSFLQKLNPQILENLCS